MSIKKVGAKRNPKTGSYTVRVRKSARTGKFTSTTREAGTIQIQGKTASR